MSVKVRLAALLAEQSGGPDTLDLEGGTVGEVLRRLGEASPALAPLLWAQPGRSAQPAATGATGATAQRELNPMLVVILNQENVKSRQGMATPVKTGDELMVVSSLEGG